MKTVHVVYSAPLIWSNFIDKIAIKFFTKLPTHRFAKRFIYPRPLCSPFSITKILIHELSKNFNVKFYDLREHTTICPDEGDVLIGHMWPDRKSVMWNSLENKKFHARYLIGPFNHDEKQVGWFREAVEKSDLFFSIVGDHWFKTLNLSPFASCTSKMVQLHMFVDQSYYPKVKKKFRKSGDRRFFYIGRYGAFGDEKGIACLEELARANPNFVGGFICSGGEIKGWRKISEPRNLTADFMAMISEEYDFFINMSRCDAQATTVLEAMAWGFPVLCTPESGYGEDACIANLSLVDMEFNLEVIEKYQQMSESELNEIVRSSHNLLKQKYSPTQFIQKIMSKM